MSLEADRDVVIPGNTLDDWPEIHNPELGIDVNDDPEMVIDWTQEISVPKINIDRLKAEQPKDEFIKHMISYLRTRILPQKEHLARQIATLGDKFFMEDGILMHYSVISLRHVGAILAQVPVIPASMTDGLISQCHATHLKQYAGINKTVAKLTRIAYWNTMLADVRTYIKQCVCQVVNAPRTTRHMASQMKTNTACYCWSLDVAYLPKASTPTLSGTYSYCLICVENFTRYVVLAPLRHLTATCIATALHNEIICQFGPAQVYHCDRGAEFVSSVTLAMLKMFGSHMTFSPSYHKQANGLAEAYICLVRQKLRLYLTGRPHSEWINIIKSVQYGLNISPQIQSSCFSSLELMLGSVPVRRADALLSPHDVKLKEHEAYMKALRYRQTVAHRIVTANLKATQEFLLHKHRQLAEVKTFDVGDPVWVYIPRQVAKPGESAKLKHLWKGPMTVVDRISKHLYSIKSKTGKISKSPFDISRLRKFTHPVVRPCGKPSEYREEIVAWADSDPSVAGTMPATHEQCAMLGIRKPSDDEETLLNDDVIYLWEDAQEGPSRLHNKQKAFQYTPSSRHPNHVIHAKIVPSYDIDQFSDINDQHPR